MCFKVKGLSTYRLARGKMGKSVVKSRRSFYVFAAIVLVLCISVAVFLSNGFGGPSAESPESGIQPDATGKKVENSTVSQNASSVISSQNGSLITKAEALKIAMPVIEQYAQENGRTIAAVDAMFEAAEPDWNVSAGFVSVQASAQTTVVGYNVLIEADTGKIKSKKITYDYTKLEEKPPTPVAGKFDHVVIDGSDFANVRVVGDVNGDGFADVVGAKENAGLFWYEYPSWVRHSVHSFNWVADDIEVMDVNVDGFLDVVGVQDDDGKVFWFENPRSQGNSASDEWASHFVGTCDGFVNDLEVADFNRDGKSDVAARTASSTLVFIQVSPTSWNRIKTLDHGGMGDNSDGLAAGDIDGDGIPDLVLNGFWFDVPADLASGDWARYSIDSKWFSQDGGDWRDNNAKVALADVNGDGGLDVVFSQSEKPGFPVSWYESSDPKSEVWVEHVVGFVDFCHTLRVGDMDGDGDLDVVVGKFQREDDSVPAPYFVKVFYNEGGGLAWDEFLVADVGIYTGVIGDIGGDGDLDIVGSRSYWVGPVEMWVNKS